MNEFVATDADSGAEVVEALADAAPTGRLGPLGRAAVVRPPAERDFRLVWAGESVSLVGDQFHFVALAWLVLTGAHRRLDGPITQGA